PAARAPGRWRRGKRRRGIRGVTSWRSLLGGRAAGIAPAGMAKDAIVARSLAQGRGARHPGRPGRAWRPRPRHRYWPACPSGGSHHMSRPVLAALSLLLFAVAPPAAAREAPPELAGLDATVEAVRDTFKVPGVAVAVVKDGEVVFAGGWGEREVGKAGRVDGDTLFSIASITKAFTSASLSILADEGRLDMDDRVIDHLPWFRMADPYVTREMRIRDLLVHRSGLGLGAGDLLFWPPTDYSTREVVQRLAHVPLEGGFRDRYAYDNILYAVAQLVIEEVSGRTYADFVRERLFEPVGMASTRIDSNALRPTDTNVATGHARPGFTGDPVPVPHMSWSNNTAAGGIYSSARDMAKWMRVQLAGGVLEGEGDAANRRLSAQGHGARAAHVLVEQHRRRRHLLQRPRHGEVDARAAGWRRAGRRGRRGEPPVQRQAPRSHVDPGDADPDPRAGGARAGGHAPELRR